MFPKVALSAAALLLASSTVGSAQYAYQTPYPPAYQPSAAPSAWSYDPYTSGMAGCVQANWGNYPPCWVTLRPTYGQPDYWPDR